MSQLDIFGGSMPLATQSKDPYTPAAYDYPTCWEDCQLCGTWLHSRIHKDPKLRVFAICQRTEAKCFEADAICDKAKRRARPKPAKPATSGWDDY